MTDVPEDDAFDEAQEIVRLRDVFLNASSKILPAVSWRELPSGGLKYPYPSPAPSSLAVAFDDVEITVYFGPEILWHAHFSPNEYGTTNDYDRVATKALAFINECVQVSPKLREAFLGVSAKILPGIEWRESPSGLWEYPHSSPVLGSLAVALAYQEIDVVFAPRHLRHLWYFRDRRFLYHDDTREEFDRVATKALAFINELVSDRIALRWGPRASGTYSERWLQTPLGQIVAVDDSAGAGGGMVGKETRLTGLAPPQWNPQRLLRTRSLVPPAWQLNRVAGEAPAHDPNRRLTGWNIAAVPLGGLFWALVVIGTSVPVE